CAVVVALPRNRSSLSWTGSPPPESYTLSLHDALPISVHGGGVSRRRSGKRLMVAVAVTAAGAVVGAVLWQGANTHTGSWFGHQVDRKSTRLNSSHRTISYAVFCLKKKKHEKIRSGHPQ